jgi:hypothetical protein
LDAVTSQRLLVPITSFGSRGPILLAVPLNPLSDTHPMGDSLMDLRDEVRVFAEERDWG